MHDDDGAKDASAAAIRDLLLVLDRVTSEIKSGPAPGLSAVREIYFAVDQLMEALAEHGYHRSSST